MSNNTTEYGRDASPVFCPVCDAEPRIVYRDRLTGDIYGCDRCVEAVDIDDLRAEREEQDEYDEIDSAVDRILDFMNVRMED